MYFIYKALKFRFYQHVRFWYWSHISKYLGSNLIAHAVAVELAILILVWVCIYIFIVYVDSKCSGESARLQDSPEQSLFWHFNEYLYQIKYAGSFDLFFVTSYNLFSLILNIQIINRMQLHSNDHVPMWHA